MRRTASVILNALGQTLEQRVPGGRPSAGTFEVFRNYSDDDAAPEFSGSVVVDTPNTTVSAASGTSQPDPQKISLTSTAGIVLGRRYRLSENSVIEWVEPVEIRATYIRVRHPLQNDYTTAAAFVSTTVTASVDSTFIADLDNLSDLEDTAPDYRVRWELTVAGATIVLYSFFDVVRVDVGHGVDIEDVNERAPGLRGTLPTEYRVEDGRPLVDSAFKAVKAHFAANLFDVQALRDDQVLDELVILRALRILAEGGWHPPAFTAAEYVVLTTQNYDRFFEVHFGVTMKHQTSIAAGAAQRDAPSVPFWSK